jgi:hypothetical protein
MHVKSVLLTIALLMTLSAAGAQAPPTPTTPPEPTAPPSPSRAGDCARHERGADGSTTGQTGQALADNQPLADKLAKSDGVLCPPSGVDPEMRAPAPDVGKMPVIPPPGSPGGDPTVRPK